MNFSRVIADDDDPGAEVEPVEFHGVDHERIHDAVFAALDDPYRRAMLILMRRCRDVIIDEIVVELGLSEPEARAHLRILIDAGLVRVDAVGDDEVFMLDPGVLDDLVVQVLGRRQDDDV
ncbi:winged helix-turn-helix domain-containing protein [Spelaeicoccus albus]|uniref:DNA-binding transcriptional ArsR family regulator n=1 Tax=Spelaeicoccus albus TaxID=1280376 RepID=A0A7Z0IHL7_9MICO|nr:winged helix-turn-helix domain-containing protein [Spelaeicoccus albus]NYI67805.1 DNA-binding transcriptional ArsR family regulator [Spelaeicoccus albus]